MFSTAYSSAAQLRNDASTIFTRVSESPSPASAQCQIGPRQPSTRLTAYAPGRSGPVSAKSGPAGARRAAAPISAADCRASSIRTMVRAHTSPVS